MIDLKGKVAVVTGSTRGIGRSVVEKLAENGADVVIIGSSAIEKIEEIASEISAKYGVEALAVQTDVTSKEAVKNLVNKTIEKFGRVDILVNNAGITRDGLFMRMKDEDWDSVMDVNLKGVFYVTQGFYRTMTKQRSGSIINMTSVVGLTGNMGQVNYATSKAGLIGMTKSLARESAKRNVRVNAIAPGYIKSDMTNVISFAAKEAMLNTIPLGKMGEPEDIANAVLFLASDLSTYITGQTLSVNGGMIMP
jgi:3-oxoacyl-[acyl-carrier protein] reductase